MALIGAAVDRVDGRLKVTGQAHYSADVVWPRMTHGVRVLSTIASGRITAIDSAEAERMPGVLLVMSHLNAPQLPDGGRAGHRPAGGGRGRLVAWAASPGAFRAHRASWNWRRVQ